MKAAARGKQPAPEERADDKIQEARGSGDGDHDPQDMEKCIQGRDRGPTSKDSHRRRTRGPQGGRWTSLNPLDSELPLFKLFSQSISRPIKARARWTPPASAAEAMKRAATPASGIP